MTNKEKQVASLFMCEEIESAMKADDFQRNFFDSLHEQVLKGRVLSEKQYECLERIHERVTGV